MLVLFHGWFRRLPARRRNASRPKHRPRHADLSYLFEPTPPVVEEWFPLTHPRRKAPPRHEVKPPRPADLSYLFEPEPPVVEDWFPLTFAHRRRATPPPPHPRQVDFTGVFQDLDAQKYRGRNRVSVPHDPRREPRARAHQQIVAVMLNSLLRHDEIVQTGQNVFEWGYVPTRQEDWFPPAPTTVGEAIQRLAALAASLHGGAGA